MMHALLKFFPHYAVYYVKIVCQYPSTCTTDQSIAKLTLSCPGTGRAIVKIGHSNLRPGSKELCSHCHCNVLDITESPRKVLWNNCLSGFIPLFFFLLQINNMNKQDKHYENMITVAFWRVLVTEDLIFLIKHGISVHNKLMKLFFSARTENKCFQCLH